MARSETDKHPRRRPALKHPLFGWLVAALGCFCVWFALGFWPKATANYCLAFGLYLIALGLVFAYHGMRQKGTPASTAIVVVAVVVFAVGTRPVWFQVVELPRLKSQVWEGTIVRKYRRIGAVKGAAYGAQYVLALVFGDSPKDLPREWRKYVHYWSVETANGATIVVKVNNAEWSFSDEGDFVRKIHGERWPYVDRQKRVERMLEESRKPAYRATPKPFRR
jgi:hypothetical protein